MQEGILMIIGISILIAAIAGMRSGITTALMEIAAGLIVGNIFNIPLPEVVYTLSELGLITLMFMAGLEIDWRFLRNKGQDSIFIGSSVYLASFITILVGTIWWLDLSFSQGALFAIGLSAASVGVVYPILKRAGILGPRRKLILSAVTVTEFLSMILLGIFYSDITWIVVLVVLFILATRKIINYLYERYHWFQNPTTENFAIKVILAILLTAEFLAAGSGLDPILIVFILGMMLSEYVESHETLKQEVETIGFGFLTPIFFFAIGYEVALGDFFTVGKDILVVLIISFTVTYLVTYWIAKKLFPKRAHIMGMLFNAPMSIGIVAATIGLEKEVLNHEQYLILLGAVLISSLIGVLFGKYPGGPTKAFKSKSVTL